MRAEGPAEGKQTPGPGPEPEPEPEPEQQERHLSSEERARAEAELAATRDHISELVPSKKSCSLKLGLWLALRRDRVVCC